jgi:hypothetical protein
MSELTLDTRILDQVVTDLDADQARISGDDLVDPEVLDQALICWALMEDAHRRLAIVRAELGRKLAGALDTKTHTVEGVGTFEKKKKTDRRKWDTENLLREVVDHRVVDEDTGEVLSPLDKVLRLWNLGTPRLTPLREWGFEPDDWCEAEDAGYSLTLMTNQPKPL